MTWLENKTFENALSQIVFQTCPESLKDVIGRGAGVVKEIETVLESYSWAPVVRSLRTLRGVDLITAFTITERTIRRKGPNAFVQPRRKRNIRS
jgi:hypothetical protein